MRCVEIIFQTFSRIKRFLFDNQLYAITLAFVSILVYSLYILIPFGTVDDYRWAWHYILFPEKAGMDLLLLNIMESRFFYGLNLWLFFKPSSISYFGIYRLLNLFLLIIFSLILFNFLSQGTNKRNAMLLSIIICTLPSFSIFFYFAILTGVIAGGILSGLAVWLLKDFQPQKNTQLRIAHRFFFSFLLLLMALQFYQPIAMLFWVFVAIVLLGNCQSQLKPFVKKYLIYIGVFVLALIVAFLLIKIAPRLTGFSVLSRTSIVGLGNLGSKIDWFFIKIRKNITWFIFVYLSRRTIFNELL